MNVKPLKQDLIDQALKAPSTHLPRHRQGEEFLKGPIPLHWWCLAASLPGKTLAIGSALWFKAGITKRNTIHLTGKLLAKFGVGRKAGYRGLKRLERARLISVSRYAGRCPVVTILEVRPKEKKSECCLAIGYENTSEI